MAAPSSDRRAVHIVKNKLRVNLRLTPKASRNAIAGIANDADGQEFVKASVTTVAEGGKANAHLIKLLSKEWGLAKSNLAIVQGAASRRKVIEIDGDAATVKVKITAWIKNLAKEKQGKNNG